jgi:uncharacterized protein YjeT (DUF2065 family)
MGNTLGVGGLVDWTSLAMSIDDQIRLVGVMAVGVGLLILLWGDK